MFDVSPDFVIVVSVILSDAPFVTRIAELSAVVSVMVLEEIFLLPELMLYFAESYMLSFSFIPIPEESGFPPCGISIPPLKISMLLILFSEL